MSRPQTPASASHAPITELDRTSQPAYLQSSSRPTSYVGSAAPGSHALDQTAGAPRPTSALSQNDGGLHDEGSVIGTQPSVVGTDRPGTMQRSNSQLSKTTPSRSGTLKKKASMKGSALNRSGSRKSSYAGSVRSMKLGEKEKYETEESNSAFYCPIPTSGNPTELLATRFHGTCIVIPWNF